MTAYTHAPSKGKEKKLKERIIPYPMMTKGQIYFYVFVYKVLVANSQIKEPNTLVTS